MNSRQRQFFITIVAGLLVERSSCLFHPDDFSLHWINVLHVLFHLLVVLVNAFNLSLQLTHQKLLDYFKAKNIYLFFWLEWLRFLDSDVVVLAVGLFRLLFLCVWQNLEHKQRWKHIVLTNKLQGLFKVQLAVLSSFEIAEVGQCLDPQVTIDTTLVFFLHIGLHEHHRPILVFANVKHSVWEVLSNVKVKQLLS